MKDVFGLSSVADPDACVLVISAHPDDEVIGLGARMPELRRAWFLNVTNGAPANGQDAFSSGFHSVADYEAARRTELAAALQLAGIDPARSRSLRIPDQEASLHLHEITSAIVEHMRQLNVRVVVTHPYEGGHPDHDATAFAVHAACRILRGHNLKEPVIIEMTSYHQGPGGIEPECFLPGNGNKISEFRLTPEEKALKRRMLACFKTQQETLQYFPLEVERFRFAPCYRFTSSPHSGTVFYEHHNWGMTTSRFTTLVSAALAQLGLGGGL